MIVERHSQENIASQGSHVEENSTENQSTGLPGLRSWSRVYLVVVVVFIVWVGLLIMLKNQFS
jgi:hypothetical protein